MTGLVATTRAAAHPSEYLRTTLAYRLAVARGKGLRYGSAVAARHPLTNRWLWAALDHAKPRLPFAVTVPADHLLVGGLGSYNLAEWIRLSKDHSLLGMRLVESPYVTFLKEVERDGGFNEQRFFRSDYFRMIRRCQQVTGEYFGITTERGLAQQGRYFTALYEHLRAHGECLCSAPPFNTADGHSRPGSLPRCFRIERTNHFEILHGHHRLAAHYACGYLVSRIKVVGLSTLAVGMSPRAAEQR